jgi:hypothetical protein
MKLKCLWIVLLFVIIFLPACALADNGVNVIKPLQFYGVYGDLPGQIDDPISVRMDVNDNMYVLQDISYSGKHRRVISVFDKNFSYVKTFDVVKTSMVDPGLDRAPYGRNLYYDNAANSMDIGDDGSIYVLSGWDVMVYYNNGSYRTQFPVSSFMTWIGSSGKDTWFYYPSGIVAGAGGKVMITSGNSPRHEILTIGPDARLLSKSDMQAGYAYDMVRNQSGNVYMIMANQSAIRVYDPTMTYENDLQLQYNGTYDSNPSAIAFFRDGNFTASANGIYIYYPNGSMINRFMDNNQTAADQNWGRLIAVNSSDFLVVVSGAMNSADTPKPISTYQYINGTISGEKKANNGNDNSFCPGILAPLLLVFLTIKVFHRYE